MHITRFIRSTLFVMLLASIATAAPALHRGAASKGAAPARGLTPRDTTVRDSVIRDTTRRDTLPDSLHRSPPKHPRLPRRPQHSLKTAH
jgi:hypothetical protein